jgi:hypothetical protein
LNHPVAVSIEPPSDISSVFLGAISFLCGATRDIAGMLTNPKKLMGWMDALGQFNTFLDSTGVGAELNEAIQKPLLAGRLMDNFKILNDIQEKYHPDRVVLAQLDEHDDLLKGLQSEIKMGHRLMRFATAGTYR